MSAGLATQHQHLLRLTTVLGQDALLVKHLEVEQSMSRMFTLELRVHSDKNHNIQADDIIGTAATAVLIDERGEAIYFNGYVVSMLKASPAQVGQDTDYMITLKPWLHYLDKESDCRIFQKSTVKEVIDNIFEKWAAIGNYTITLKRKHAQKRFWVQYNETTYNFFNRICYVAGLAYYFTFENGAHELHIVDDASSLPYLTPETINYQPGTRAHDHIVDWQRGSKYVTGNYEQRAYNYKMPSTLLTAKGAAKGEPATVPRAMDTEQYTYSEEYVNFSDGHTDTSIRALQGTAKHAIMLGQGDCRHLKTAHHFSVTPVPDTLFFPDKGKPFTLISVTISANNKGTADSRFTAVPKGELSYPSAQKTTITGLQTAVVTGPKGEEIYTDKQGRIKVQFHWDRQGKADENTTCWLRVMQSVAGPSFGAQFTPRIGQEVVVAFENGNPERPFVIGALYHPENPPPYADHKGSRMGIRTRSTKGGKANNCNELYFEDKQGREEVYLQAEKDYNCLVKHNQSLKIGRDKLQEVANNEAHSVGQQMTIKVGKTLLIDAGEKIQLQVGGSVIKMTPSGIDITSTGPIAIDGKPVALNG
ncbi:MAG: type VI secretion system tip protein VgrG [Cellvibrionaceae bacterium]|nr:type VI secretion system tip protein VgrG [Cellvibrionaceae bacterium]